MHIQRRPARLLSVYRTAQPATCGNLLQEAHLVSIQVERLLRCQVMPLQQRAFLLEQRVAAGDGGCQLELIIRILFRNNACAQRRMWQS